MSSLTLSMCLIACSIEEAFVVSEEETELFKKITTDIEKAIKGSYVIDWTTNITKTQNIERTVKNMLIGSYFKIFKKDGIDKLVPQLINLAKIHYGII